MRNIFPIMWILIAILMTGQAKAQSYPEFAKTDFVTLRDGTKIELRDGVDLSKRDLSNIEIHQRDGILRDIDFSGSDLTNADLRETIFNHCSFRGAILTNVQLCDDWRRVNDCDFTDASINSIQRCRWYPLTLEQIQSSRSWKTKDLYQVNIHTQLAHSGEINPISLAGFNLRNAQVMVREEVDLTDADIQGAHLFGGFYDYDSPRQMGVPPNQQHQDFYKTGDLEMLMETKNGKEKIFTDVRFEYFDFTGANFAGMDLSGVWFRYCNLTDADFTDAVITRANCHGDGIPSRYDGQVTDHTLTLEQIKQTWNYKHGVMNGISLPVAIQAALEAEKAAKHAATTSAGSPEMPDASQTESADTEAKPTTE